MSQQILLLCGTAASFGFLHTLLGPDHYLPFVAMSRIGNWTLRKTVVVTLLCGVGHVLSSVVLGLIGIFFGIAVFRLQAVESTRGVWAGWLLLAFGVAYSAWGVHRAIRNRPHSHLHVHADGTVHNHAHRHVDEHLHVHASIDPFAGHVHPVDRVASFSDGAPLDHASHPHPHGPEPAQRSLTPWVLFTVFLFGPCEPLIPLVMYPAAKGDGWGVALVTLIFGTATLITMTTMVVLAQSATGALGLGRYARYGHLLAGLTIVACGVAIKFGL